MPPLSFPETAYVRMIDIPSAKEGFTLLGRQYRLAAVSKRRIRMVLGDARRK